MSAAALVTDKQLGDTLMLQPAAAFLARQQGCPTALWVREAFEPLVSLMPDCTWGPHSPGPYAQVWCTSWGSRALLRAWRLPTRRRLLLINKPRHRRWWHRLAVHETVMQTAGAQYWARYFWRMVGGEQGADFVSPQLKAPPSSWAHAELTSQPYMLVNPTAAWPHKYATASHWQACLRALAPRLGPVRVILSGGGSPPEVAHAAEIVAGCDTPVVNAVGRTSLREYLHLLSGASMVLAVDGAASHLAQAFGVPALTLFGPTHEGKWHWPTTRHRCLAARQFRADGDFGPVSEIPEQAVAQAALELWTSCAMHSPRSCASPGQ